MNVERTLNEGHAASKRSSTGRAFGKAGDLILGLQVVFAAMNYYTGAGLGYEQQLSAAFGIILTLCATLLILHRSAWSKRGPLKYAYVTLLLSILVNCVYLIAVTGAVSTTYPRYLMEAGALCLLIEALWRTSDDRKDGSLAPTRPTATRHLGMRS